MKKIGMTRRLVEMLPFLRQLTKKSSRVIELYEDRNWPWLRRFVYLGILLVLSSLFSATYELIVVSVFSDACLFGALRFGFFYLPIFGLFVQVFYSGYMSDGSGISGFFYISYARAGLRDFLSFEADF